MAVVAHSVEIIAADTDRALAFDRALGLSVPDRTDGPQTELITPGGATLGLELEAMVRQAYPDWATPISEQVTFACRCDKAPRSTQSMPARRRAFRGSARRGARSGANITRY